MISPRFGFENTYESLFATTLSSTFKVAIIDPEMTSVFIITKCVSAHARITAETIMINQSLSSFFQLYFSSFSPDSSSSGSALSSSPVFFVPDPSSADSTSPASEFSLSSGPSGGSVFSLSSGCSPVSALASSPALSATSGLPFSSTGSSVITASSSPSTGSSVLFPSVSITAISPLLMYNERLRLVRFTPVASR